MVANGITRARLPASNEVICTLDDPSVPVIPHNMIFSTSRFTQSQINSWTRLFEAMRLDGTLIDIYRAHLPARVATAILNY